MFSSPKTAHEREYLKTKRLLSTFLVVFFNINYLLSFGAGEKTSSGEQKSRTHAASGACIKLMRALLDKVRNYNITQLFRLYRLTWLNWEKWGLLCVELQGVTTYRYTYYNLSIHTSRSYDHIQMFNFWFNQISPLVFAFALHAPILSLSEIRLTPW